jgi:hypothetical protein
MQCAITVPNRKKQCRFTRQIAHSRALQLVFTNFIAAEFMQ